MMKKLCLCLLLAVWLGLFPAAAWAEDISAEKTLNSEEQLEIGKRLSDLLPEGIDGYDPTKLQLSCPLPVYAYTQEGFVPVGRYLPLLFEGEPAFFITEYKNDYLVDSVMRRWWVQTGAAADKPLALVWDYDSCYYYDGADWLLLHKSIDVHYKNEDYAVLDTEQPLDMSGLTLTVLRPVQALDKAFPERLPRVAPPADENIAIYLDGEKLAAEGWLHKGRVLLPLRDICDLFDLPLDYADNTQRITLRRGRHTYSLRLNEREVLLDGRQNDTLDVPAQERDGRTYLPLRFVGRLFDLDLQWDESRRCVDIARPEQLIGGVVHHVTMTIDSWDMRLSSSILAQQMYDEIISACWDEVAAPLAENLGKYPNLDNPDFYYHMTSYDFLRPDGSVYSSFEVYVHVPGQPVPEGYTQYLIFSDEKWYITSDDLLEILEEWHNIEDWQRID